MPKPSSGQANKVLMDISAVQYCKFQTEILEITTAFNCILSILELLLRYNLKRDVNKKCINLQINKNKCPYVRQLYYESKENE